VAQAQRRFQAGVTTNVEVITAQDALARASDNQIGALFQFNVSRGPGPRGRRYRSYVREVKGEPIVSSTPVTPSPEPGTATAAEDANPQAPQSSVLAGATGFEI
jgi:hypothetical protein